MELIEGSIEFDGVALSVEFQVPVRASSTEMDAAFVAALAQQATISFTTIGETSVPAGDSGPSYHDMQEWPAHDWRQEVANCDTKLGYIEWVKHNIEAAKAESKSELASVAPARSIFLEGLDATWITIGGIGSCWFSMRLDLMAQEILSAMPFGTVITRDLYDTDAELRSCLNKMCDDFEFPDWEGRTIGQFIAKNGQHSDQSSTPTIMLRATADEGSSMLNFATLHDLRNAIPADSNDWMLPTGQGIGFRRAKGGQ